MDESDVSKNYPTLPELIASEQEAVIVVVHEYFKRCCGTAADVALNTRLVTGEVEVSHLAAAEDFTCWRIPVGEFQFVPSIEDQVFAPVSMDAKGGQAYFYKLTSDLRRPQPFELEVQPISERYAYHYINSTLERIREYRGKRAVRRGDCTN